MYAIRSYYDTSFTLEDVECSAHTIQKDEAIQISLKIKNTGDFYGGETIQVYIERMADNAPNPQLKYLKKVHLEKEETALVDLCIPADAFGLYGEDGKKAVQPGKYSVYVGTSQPDSRSLQLTGNKVYQFSLTAEEEIEFRITSYNVCYTKLLRLHGGYNHEINTS